MKGHVEAHSYTLNCGGTREVGVRSRGPTGVPFGVDIG